MRASIAFLLMAAASSCMAQPLRTDGVEYQIYTSANSAKTSVERLQILLEWENQYPNTRLQWKVMRLNLFVFAYQSLGQPHEAFLKAMELRGLLPEDVEQMVTVCTASLQVPDLTPEEVLVVKDTATGLLRRVPEVGRAAAEEERRRAKILEKMTNVADSSTDVTSMLRKWREGKVVIPTTDRATQLTEAAEKALTWAAAVSKNFR